MENKVDEIKNNFRIFFQKSTSGYHVFAEIGRIPYINFPHCGVLDKGREYINPEDAFEFAKKYIQSRSKKDKDRYNFSIDESGLSDE